MNNPTISRTELQPLVEAGAVTLVEALPAQYFEQGHLPGAINIPHTEVRELAPALLPEKDAAIVVYCANARAAQARLHERARLRRGEGGLGRGGSAARAGGRRRGVAIME